MKKWKLIIFVLSATTSLNCNSAIGTVTDQINSPGTIQRQKDQIPSTKGTGVEMNDAIKTAQGKIAITFQDETKVQINENSRLVIDDFVYDPKSKAGKLGAKVALGTVRYASGQIAKNSPQNVALNTPTATVSVRGTDFAVTVEELGESTIILLPSCPYNRSTRTVKDIESNCNTGEIEVTTDAGMVILNKPFQVTKVTSRNMPPSPPKILNLSEMAISNLLILSPPPEIRRSLTEMAKQFNPLDFDFLKERGLENVLDIQMRTVFEDKLTRNFLENEFLANIFDQALNTLDEKFLDEVDSTLPDYRRSSGIIVYKDTLHIELCRDNGADIQCIRTPRTQDSTIFQNQRNQEFRNRINQGGNTIITVIQR